MSKSKLELVLEYLMNEQEDKAKALLHDIFIEKARAIHESIIEEEDEAEDGMPVKPRVGRAETKKDELEDDQDRVNSEAFMGKNPMGEGFEDEEDDDVPDNETEIDLGSDDDDVDPEGFEDDGEDDGEEGGEGYDRLEGEITNLTDALEDLKAAFAELSGHDDEDEEADPMLGGDEEGSFKTDVGVHDDEDDEDDDKIDEALNEFDEFMESLELEVVEKDIYSGKTKSREVGNGPKFATPDSNDHSPVPKSQTDRMGARPVKTGQGPKVSGYERPSTTVGYTRKSPDELTHGGDNRRKRAETGMEQIGSGYGKTKAMKGSRLENDGDFKTGKTDSPFTRGPKR